MSTTTASTNITTMKTTNQGISPESSKACTDEATPVRVRNVPKTVSRKVTASSHAIHCFCLFLRREMLTACSSAVAVSQGMREAFSTGSQAQ